MSVVIVGGNECMERRYKDLCEQYNCKAKVYTKVTGSVKGIGSPDLLVLFIDTMSHKMLRSVMLATKGPEYARRTMSHWFGIGAEAGFGSPYADSCKLNEPKKIERNSASKSERKARGKDGLPFAVCESRSRKES